MKTFQSLGFIMTILSLLMMAPVLAEEGKRYEAQRPAVIGTIRVLPKDVSQSLKITRVPTTQPVPLVVGGYWACNQDHGFDICRFVLVVCTENQSNCVEVPPQP